MTTWPLSRAATWLRRYAERPWSEPQEASASSARSERKSPLSCGSVWIGVRPCDQGASRRCLRAPTDRCGIKGHAAGLLGLLPARWVEIAEFASLLEVPRHIFCRLRKEAEEPVAQEGLDNPHRQRQ